MSMLTTVDLPQPDSPTMALMPVLGKCMVTCFSTSRLPS